MTITPGNRRAEFARHRLTHRGRAVVRVQRPAAASSTVHAELWCEPRGRSADCGEQHPFDTAEHQMVGGGPLRRSGRGRAIVGVASQHAGESKR